MTADTVNAGTDATNQYNRADTGQPLDRIGTYRVDLTLANIGANPLGTLDVEFSLTDTTHADFVGVIVHWDGISTVTYTARCGSIDAIGTAAADTASHVVSCVVTDLGAGNLDVAIELDGVQLTHNTGPETSDTLTTATLNVDTDDHTLGPTITHVAVTRG